MKNIVWAFLFVSGLCFAELNKFEDAIPNSPEHPLQIRWDSTKGIETPESAYWHKDSNSIFISNVAGEPNKKDGRGWITKLNTKGQTLEQEWVKGFDAPKGMRSFKDSLWVSDIDRMHEISIKDRKVKNTISVPGSVFLNDVAIDTEGNVFVSDTIGTKIYKIKKGKPEVFLEGPDLESPNGLLIEGGKLFVASWGLAAPDFSTKLPGRLYSIDLKTKKRTNITPAPFANLDGLERAKGGGFWVTDWMLGKIFYINEKGKSYRLLEGWKGTADIAYLPSESLMVVPRMNENIVTAIITPEFKL